MHACNIRQYLIRKNVFCTISPKFTLANNLSYTLAYNFVGKNIDEFDE